MKTFRWFKTLIPLSCMSLSFCIAEDAPVDSNKEIAAQIFTPSSSGKADPAYDEIKEIVLDFITAMRRNDTHMLDELLAPNYKIINYGEVTQTSYSKYTEMSKNLKVRVNALHKAIPDFELKVNDIIAERDKVVVQGTISGIQKGDFMGIAPTNKPVHLKFFSTFTIRGDKIMMISEMWNEINVMKQLGYIVL